LVTGLAAAVVEPLEVEPELVPELLELLEPLELEVVPDELVPDELVPPPEEAVPLLVLPLVLDEVPEEEALLPELELEAELVPDVLPAELELADGLAAEELLVAGVEPVLAVEPEAVVLPLVVVVPPAGAAVPELKPLLVVAEAAPTA